MLDAFAVTAERRGSVEAINRLIEGGVRAAQVAGHGVWII
jgi:hypothetical protein